MDYDSYVNGRATDLEADIAGHEVGGVSGESRGAGGAGVVGPFDERLLLPLAFQQDEALVQGHLHLLTWYLHPKKRTQDQHHYDYRPTLQMDEKIYRDD